MNRRGLDTGVALLASMALLTVGLVAVGLTFSGTLTEFQQTQVDYDGEFDVVQPPQDATGANDLSVTEQTLNTTGIVDDGNVVAKFDVNGSDGQTLTFAYGFEVSGSNGFEDLEVNGGLASATTTSEMEIRSVYLYEDREGVNFNTPEDAMASIPVNEDLDGIERTDIGQVDEGEYVMVVNTRGIDTSTIAADDDLLDVDLEGDSDADSPVDELHTTIDNQ